MLWALIRATHPVPAGAVTGLVGVMTAARGGGEGVLMWVMASTAVGQASIGWSNDYIDRARDAAAGRTDKPLVRESIPDWAVLVAAVIALPLCGLLSVPLGAAEAAVMMTAVGGAWAYNLGLKGTVFSWLPYGLAFGLAPVYVWLVTPPGDPPPAWLVAVGALLGVGAHLLNVIPDLEADRAAAVRGLPHRLGPGGSVLAACAILIAALALVVTAGGVGRWTWVPAVGAVTIIAAAALAGWRGRGRLGFLLAILAAGAIVGTLILSPSGLR